MGDSMSLTLAEWLLATVVLLVGTIIQGSVGFGVALLGAPVLFWIDPGLVPGPMLIVGMALPFLILVRERRSLDVRGVRWAVPGQLSGAAVAALVLAEISNQGLSLIFGLLVLFAVALSAFAGAPKPTPGRLLAAGSMSGFMATATSIGGPPLALVYQAAPGGRLRATLSAIFVVGGFGSLTALAWIGRFGMEEFLAGLSLLPGVLAGFWLSGYTARALDRAWLRPAVLAVSAVAGAAAVADAVW